MQPPGSKGIEVGHRSIRGHLGTTHLVFFPFQTDVLAYWGFDANNRLIEVWVDKQTDAP